MFLPGIQTKNRSSTSSRRGFAPSGSRRFNPAVAEEGRDAKGRCERYGKALYGRCQGRAFDHTLREGAIEDTEHDPPANVGCDIHCETCLFIGSLILLMLWLFGPANSFLDQLTA